MSAADETLLAWAWRALKEDVPLDVLADALPYSGAGEDEAIAVIDGLADAGWVIVPTPNVYPRLEDLGYRVVRS